MKILKRADNTFMPKRKTSFKTALSYHCKGSVLLLKQLEIHRKILVIVRSTLPEALASQATDCTLKDRKLIIYTTSPAWASQLRFYSPALLANINSKTEESIELIQFRILQPVNTMLAQKKQRFAKLPSSENIDLIHNNTVSSPDSVLKEALLKLNNKLKQLHETEGRD